MNEDSNPKVFEVDKKNLQNTRVVPLDISQPLMDNEVLLKVDKFALTANNISYGVAGDTLGYWRFFPSEEPSSWGRLPVMGYADVIASNNGQIKVGERVWGFMPMATHLKIVAGRVSESGFSDVSLHRKGLAPLYASFDRVSSNPIYQKDNEDFDILVRGLFTTSWLIDDFFDDNTYFDASQYLITSASSKTSIALAFVIKQRGLRPAIGFTSKANKEFVETLGCYDKVISYEEIADLGHSPLVNVELDNRVPSILVDMAGSEKILRSLHHYFKDQLKYSCRVGLTHHDELSTGNLATDDLAAGTNLTENSKIDHDVGLPGATPTFFFAPTQLQKRTLEWGVEKTMLKMGLSMVAYFTFCRTIISIQHTRDQESLKDVYQSVLSGKADASIGQIVSL